MLARRTNILPIRKMSDPLHRLRHAAEQLSRMVYRHTTAVLLAPPDAPDGRMRNGSGFVLRVDGQHYLGTAWHVVEEWHRRRSAGEPILFQVGDAGLDPSTALAWNDQPSDVAFLRLSAEQAAAVDVSICEPMPNWPPAHPAPNSDVFVCGFPGQLRDRIGRRDVEFRSFAAHLIVEEVRDRFVLCGLDRDVLVDVDGVDVLRSDLDLGGMSGGPAFLLGQLSYPLVALVSEFSQLNESLGLIRLATLSHVDFRIPSPGGV